MCRKNIVRHRNAAFDRQHGLCYYCGAPMCRNEAAIPAFMAASGVSRKQAVQRLCTAEHLVAQCEGGRDSAQNIAAVCAQCNRLRHRRRRPLGPEAYRSHVQARVRKKSWHSCRRRR